MRRFFQNVFSAFLVILMMFSLGQGVALATKPNPDFYTGDFVQGDDNENYSKDLFTLDGVTTILLPKIAAWIASALAGLAVIFLIYSGIQFLLARGEPEEITKAGTSAFYVFLGLLLLMFAYAMVYLFLTLFSADNPPPSVNPTPTTSSPAPARTPTPPGPLAPRIQPVSPE